jgi:hypothetical protein
MAGAAGQSPGAEVFYAGVAIVAGDYGAGRNAKKQLRQAHLQLEHTNRQLVNAMDYGRADQQLVNAMDYGSADQQLDNAMDSGHADQQLVNVMNSGHADQQLAAVMNTGSADHAARQRHECLPEGAQANRSAATSAL